MMKQDNTFKPWISNESYSHIKSGNHKNPGKNSLLIQIVDVDMDFPEPYFSYESVIQLRFNDTNDEYDDTAITRSDAITIAKWLRHAKKYNMNVIVHCVAGLCRSGAVVEVATMIGFEALHNIRQPNSYVKKMLMREFDLLYPEQDV